MMLDTDDLSSIFTPDALKRKADIENESRELAAIEIPKLVPDTHPIMSQKLERFDFDNPPEDPEKIAQILLKAVIKYQGLGISANQLGLPYRVFALKGNPSIGIPNFVCFNPRIATTMGDEQNFDEGCLTYPGLYVKVKRPGQVRARFQSPYGEIITKTFVGLTARCYLHECDHMDGINFIDRANKIHRERAKKNWKILKRRMKQ